MPDYQTEEEKKREILAWAQSRLGPLGGASTEMPAPVPPSSPLPIPRQAPELPSPSFPTTSQVVTPAAQPDEPEPAAQAAQETHADEQAEAPQGSAAMPAQAQQTPATGKTQDDPILSYLMAQQGRQQAPATGPQGHAEVPKIEGPSQGGLAVAAFLDAMLNRGRNVGSLLGAMAQGDKTPQQQAQLQMEADKNQAEVWHLTHPSAVGGADPMSQYIRLKQMEGLGEWRKYQEGQGKTRMEQGAKRLDLKEQGMKLASAERDAKSPISQHMRDYFASSGVEVDPNLSAYEMKQLKPELAKQFGQAVQQQDAEARGAAKKAAAVSAATLPDKKDLQANAAGLRDQSAEKKAAGAQYDEQVQNFNDTHPMLEVFNEGTYKSKLANTRSRAQMDKDIQTVDRATAASEHLLSLAKQWSAAEMVTDLQKQRSLEQEYQLYKKEHVGIINQIEGVKGGGTQEARTDIEKELPERLNPFAVARLEGVKRFVHSQGHETLRVYGVGVRGMGESTPATKQKPAPARSKPSPKKQDDPSDLAAELGM